MKSLREYIAESEHAASQPVTGDYFAINIREETLFETWVCDETQDGIVIYADDVGMQLLEDYGYLGESVMEMHHIDDYEADSDGGEVDVIDQGEYDYEGDQAKDQLRTIVRAARRLNGMLDDEDNLPEWVQMKITKAEDYLDTAADYMESNREQGVAEGIRDDAMAGLQKTVDFAKQHGYKIYRSPTGRKIRFVNKELEHEIRAQVDNYDDSINVNFMDYYTGTSGNDDASYFDQVFKDAYEQALGDYENRRSDDDVGLYTRSQLQQKQGVGVAEGEMDEAKYQGREVPLGKPMKGDVKKSKVYVRGPKGNVVKVNFGQKGMKIKKNIPGRRKNFRARHNCDNPGPRWKARYWSCRAW